MDNYERQATILSAIDGDTVRCQIILYDDGSETIPWIRKIRLSIIDTPEKHQKGYEEATEFTKQFVGQNVNIKLLRKTTFDRIMGDLIVIYEGKQISLSQLLLEKGLAKVYGK